MTAESTEFANGGYTGSERKRGIKNNSKVSALGSREVLLKMEAK